MLSAIDLEAELLRAELGDLSSVPELLDLLTTEGANRFGADEGIADPSALLAWRCRFEALHAILADVLPPDIVSLNRLAGGAPPLRKLAIESAYLSLLHRLLDSDRDGADRYHQVLSELVSGIDRADWPSLTLFHRAGTLLFRHFHGGALGDDELQAVIHGAARAAIPRLVTAMTALRALVGIEARRVESAIELARRASRMAGSEGVLVEEYFANLVLARARRYGGTPELALRILGVLGRVVPTAWRSWVEWEALLAGGSLDASIDRAAAPLSSATQSLVRLMDSARAGDRTSVTAARGSLARGGELAPPFQREVHALCRAFAIDVLESEWPWPLGRPMVADHIDAWLAGGVDTVPGELAGLSGPRIGRNGAEMAGVYAIASPHFPARRVLGVALSVLDSGAAAEVEGQPRQQARVSAALAALVLAGPAGLSDEDLFERVYGFGYEARHHGVYRNLITKVRQRLGDGGDVDRTEHGYVLRPRRTVFVPDPRCAPSLEELILRTMASWDRGAGSQELATALKVPLRTVQAALGELVEGGACLAEREGRNTRYRLEDTTFHEPTVTRLSPRP